MFIETLDIVHQKPFQNYQISTLKKLLLPDEQVILHRAKADVQILEKILCKISDVNEKKDLLPIYKNLASVAKMDKEKKYFQYYIEGNHE